MSFITFLTPRDYAFFRLLKSFLENPHWDESLQAFPSILDSEAAQEFRSISQIHGKLSLSTGATITRTGATVAHDGSFWGPRDQLKGFVEKLEKEDLVAHYEGLSYLRDCGFLRKRTFHSTAKIRARHSPNENMVYCPHKVIPSGSQPSAGKCRPFTTGSGIAGIASDDIQPGDLLCAIEAIPGLFVVIRREESDPSLSLVSTAIICWSASANSTSHSGRYFNMKEGTLGIYHNYPSFQDTNGIKNL
jgi:hypothetical protein